MNKKQLSFFIPVILLFAITICNAGGIKYKQYYKGLPDFEHNSPFISQSQELNNNLNKLIRNYQFSQTASSGLIKIKDKEKKDNMYAIIQKMAPSLIKEQTSFWISEDKNKLLIGYNVLDSINNDPYFSIWFYNINQPQLNLHYAGHFLNGEFHALKKFGPQKLETIFIKFNSCTECEPIIFLIGIEFITKPEGTAFEFTYSEDHKSWDKTIEYSLPGMGHTVEADITTRIPIAKDGPCLIQYYKMKEGKDEWWLFNCKDHKCDYEMYHELPAKFKNNWVKSDNL